MSNVLASILSLAALATAPWLAARIMGLSGGIARSALVGAVSLGLMQIVGMLASFLGPLGPILGIMAFIAAWFQLVKVVHGTDVAHTVVFMFWQVFFLFLQASLLAMFFGPSAVTWWIG